MDFFSKLDAPVFSRFVFCLHQYEALKLAAVTSAWPELVTAHFRKLVIAPSMPISAACVAAKGFHRLRKVVLEAEIDDCDRGCFFWEAATRLLVQLLGKAVESLVVRSLSLSGSSAERRAQMQFLRTVIEAIPSCPSLQHIGLEDLPFSEDNQVLEWLSVALKNLAPTSMLTSLSFANCAFGSCGVTACVASIPVWIAPKIEELDLSNNVIGVEGAGLLAQALPKFRKLRSLKLSGNGLGPTGAQALRMGLAAVSESLEILDVSFNGLQAEGVASLVPASLHLKDVCLACNWIAAEGANSLLQMLQSMSHHLTKLDIAQNKLNAEGVWSLLEQWPMMPLLRSLKISENYFARAEFANSPFRRLSECAPILEELDLKANSLGSSDLVLKELAAHLPLTLTTLHLGAGQFRAPQLQMFIDAMPTMPHLSSLSFVAARLDDDAVDILASASVKDKLPQLQYLDLTGNYATPHAVKRLVHAMAAIPGFKRVKAHSQLMRPRPEPMRPRPWSLLSEATRSRVF